MFITGRRQDRLDEAVASIGPAATGNPYGASSTDPQDRIGPSEQELAAARYQGKRIAEKAAILAAARV
ncbi:MAG TPA: hypothetical protein VGV91_14775 [Rubrobacter sp.]|nr:hypothetical protein [Rubrobacter sp.]